MSRKLTHDEQVAAIAKVNPNVEILGEITGNAVKVLCLCKICHHKWEAMPAFLKSGKGCPECAKVKIGNAHRLTNAEHVAAIKKVNPNIEILEEIRNVKEKVLCRCTICHHKWEATPDNLKNGNGCPACAGNRKLSHKEQVEAIAKVNPDVEILEEIKGSNKKVLCKCKICRHEWRVKPVYLKSGKGCPKCAGVAKLSHTEQVAAIAKVNPNVKVLEEIVGNNKKVLCRCKVCSHEWEATPKNLKKGTGCPKCAGRGHWSHEMHMAVIKKINPDVEVLGKIIGNRIKVLCRCKICNNEWMAIPGNLKQGQGCPECAKVKIGDALRLTHDEQVEAIKKVNPDVEVLGEITGGGVKVLCRCLVCGHEWKARPDTLKRGQGCPKCAKYGFLSKDVGKLYIMVDNLEAPTIMKIGVSVNEDKRSKEVLKSTRKAGVTIPALYVAKTWEGPTDLMQRIESMMHENYAEWNIKFPTKFDGFTEFFYYTPETAGVFDAIDETYYTVVNQF